MEPQSTPSRLSQIISAPIQSGSAIRSFFLWLWWKKLVLIIVSIIVFVSLVIAIALVIEPFSTPQGVFITNVTEGQATVSWTTVKPTKGIILISEDGKFPLSPVFADLIYKDDGEKGLPTVGRYLTHSVTIGNLKPLTVYQYQVYEGLRKAYLGSFVTAPTLSTIIQPNPVYGTVLQADGKTPLVGGLVYFRVEDGTNSSSTLSTLTNLAGRWTLDLANLRTPNFKASFVVQPNATQEVVVESGNKGTFKSATSSAFTKPWPTILLKRK